MTSPLTPGQSAPLPTSAPGPAPARAEASVGVPSGAPLETREVGAVDVSGTTQSAVLVGSAAESGVGSMVGSKSRGAGKASEPGTEGSGGRATPAGVQAAVAGAPESRGEGDDAARGARRAAAGAAARQKNNVRKIRIERMMSKAELARRANLSVLTIDRIEKGFGCRMDTKRKILEALGLSLDDRVRVFGEEE
jgi:DNA-binding XRE family transcriptional regulator